MKGDIRREGILSLLKDSDSPVTAGALSEKFGVSRQIIVKDIAKLRENGSDIISLSRGYILDKAESPARVFKVRHSDDDVERELNLIVDLGGRVDDVFIYHKVYSKVHADMNIRSRRDVAAFLCDISSGKSSLLKNVTSGYHYHTVSADNAATLDMIEAALSELGFLAPLQEYEPIELIRS